ncbi:type IV secretory system conjugative DNA transfer family protein [Amycolatopsis sp. cmx-8-4]|uniref:type IV secretory system conjugative DNA transfer family protein n=1 Tax=Amycolatopsis sp. cmx-8-4 TaxID=2790947 RepID=UPI00397DC64D
MIELRWFEAVPPRKTSVTEVTALVRVLAGRSHYGVRKLQPVVVFETWLRPEGVRWLVGIEPRIARTLRGSMLSQLPGLTLTPVDEPQRPEPITARELRFTSLAYPLRTDTADGVTAGIMQARDQLRDGEALVVQWVVGPSHRYVRQPIEQTPLDLLGFTTPREPDAGDRQAWKQKVAEPLFGVRGRLGAVAAEPRWAGALLRPVLSALSLANGNQSRMRASQQSSRTATQLIQVMGRARTWPGMVNAAELAVLLGWSITGLDVPGGPTGFAPPPAGLLRSPEPDAKATAARPLGISTHPASRGALVQMPVSSYAAGTHVIGPPGVGKSNLLAAWSLGEAQAGGSLVIIEPKGDLVVDVLVRMPIARHGDVVVIDPAADGPVVGFNPLAGSRSDAERRADSLLHVFRELFGTAIGPRSADVLLHALIMAARLPDGTLTDVMPLLTNPGFRRRVVGQVGDPLIIAPWVAWFDGLSEAERMQVVAPIGNKLRVFTSRPGIRRLLGQAAPRFDLASVFERPTVLLVNLNAGAIGSGTSQIIGALILNQLWEAIQRQTTLPERKRRPVSVVVDEFQTFAGALDFADVFARSRGARVPFTVAHQHLDQLSPNLRTAVLAAIRTRVVFRPAEGDSRVLARVLGDPVTPEDLERLPAFHAAVRVLIDGAPSQAFAVATPPLGAVTGNGDTLRRASAERFGVPPDELDVTILKRWQGGETAPDAPIGARRRRS